MNDKRYICIKSLMYDPKIVTTIASVGRSQMSRCLDVMRLSVPCHHAMVICTGKAFRKFHDVLRKQ